MPDVKEGSRRKKKLLPLLGLGRKGGRRRGIVVTTFPSWGEGRGRGGGREGRGRSWITFTLSLCLRKKK